MQSTGVFFFLVSVVGRVGTGVYVYLLILQVLGDVKSKKCMRYLISNII